MIREFHQRLVVLKKNYHSIYTEFEISNLLLSLSNKNENRIYYYKLNSLAYKLKQIKDIYGKSTFEEIRKMVLLESVIRSWDDIYSDRYPKSIQEQFTTNLNRFKLICDQEQGWGRYIEDVFWKDLAIARQQMFPIGPGVVEAFSGFGFRQGLNRDIFQSIKFLLFILAYSGRKGFYQVHTHTPLLSEFNEKGWTQSYFRIAEMLKKCREIKGVFRVSWFCDPKVSGISPHLSYLREMPVQNGGKLFYFGEDSSGNAFVKSQKRLDLYNKGEYIPKIYMMIWPRKAILSWADSLK